MFDKTKNYTIKNRCAGICVYSIPSLHIERLLQPGQSIKVSGEEIERLMWERGGKAMVSNYLQILDEEVLEEFDIETEPEYNMSENDVIELIKNGSLDEFKDALDFAPEGVIDLIKTFAVSLPISDANKMNAIKEATGFDVESAIRHNREDKEEDSTKTETTKKTRRTKKATSEESSTTTVRRTAPKEYKTEEEAVLESLDED